MFARTPRLLLRPGFPEDAPALAAAIADEQIVRHLATAPWPYRMRDATALHHDDAGSVGARADGGDDADPAGRNRRDETIRGHRRDRVVQ